MTEPLVTYITLATRPEEEWCKRLLTTAEMFDVPLKVHTEGGIWRGFGTKPKVALREARIAKSKYICFMDGYDVLIVRSREQIEQTILGLMGYLDHPFLVSAEKNLWPDRTAEVIKRYNEVRVTNVPFRYVNSGLYVADREYLIRLFEAYNVDSFTGEEDDQRFLTKLYFEQKVELDIACDLFLSVAFTNPAEILFIARHPKHANRFPFDFRNSYTSRNAGFLHGNGRTDLTEYWKLLEAYQ